MIRAKITGVSYKPPRTIGIQYSVSPLVFGLELPIEKCDQLSDINAAIQADYTEKIQDPNNTYLRHLSQNIVGTEFDFELDGESGLRGIETDKQDLERKKFIIAVIEDMKKCIPDDIIITCGCENCMPGQ